MISKFGQSALGRRLAKGLGATALGPVVTAIIQFGTVPLLLHAWGAAKYGDWLLLSAVPSYLNLSNMGFGDASASDMTVRVAAGDRRGALETFQSSWVLLTVASMATLLLASGIVWWLPWAHWLHLSSLSNQQAGEVVIALGAYTLVGQQISVFESGYRCDGNFASGTFWAIVLRLLETIAATAVALLSASLLSVALTFLAARLLGTIFYWVILRSKSPWLRMGVKEAKLASIKKLAAPALGFLAFPAGQALSLQGFNLVLGALQGPVAVTAFATSRTLARVNFQLVNTLALALWPELSSAFGAGNIQLARKLHRHAFQAALMVSLLGSAALWLAGPSLYRIWIRGAVPFDATCFHVLLLVTIANSFWYTSSVVPMSTNEHHRIALAYVIGTAFSLALAWVLIPYFGVIGASLALLLIDAAMTWLVLGTALRQVGDHAGGFLGSIFTLPFSRRVPEAAAVRNV